MIEILAGGRIWYLCEVRNSLERRVGIVGTVVM